jgi:3-oxoacyl-[acyl-carrier protein] reductase
MASYVSLKGKTYIVTGAASGMGRAISKALAKQGANVGLVDLNKPDKVLQDIEKLGGKGISLAANVQDATAINTAFKAVVDKFGKLDGAANMAGTVGKLKLGDTSMQMEEILDVDWDFQIGTNLNGVKNSIRAELQLMKGPGSIVSAASIASFVPTTFNAPYGVAKSGVVSMTRTVAQEVGKKNIRVNAVAPLVYPIYLLY